MAFEQIRKSVVERVSRVVTSERALQLLAAPRVQKVLTVAIEVQVKLREGWKKGVGAAARSLELATRDDVAGLKRTIRSLESQVKRLQSEREKTP